MTKAVIQKNTVARGRLEASEVDKRGCWQRKVSMRDIVAWLASAPRL